MQRPCKDGSPARLELLQSLSGLLLVLFVWGHMLLDASVLISKDAMFRVARFMEGRYLLGTDYPVLVAVAAGIVLAIFILHALLAMRKFPAGWTQYRAFRDHTRGLRHSDTSLWWLQAWTGFALFFLGSVHLINMMTRPGDIGPYESADRIVGEWLWPVYGLLLIAVHLHAGIGVYRLALKWCLAQGDHPDDRRRLFQRLRWAIIGGFLILGFASLVAYVQIGVEHRGREGERYVPTWDRATGQ